MNDNLDPNETQMRAQRDDTARQMKERRQAKERRNQTTSTPPPMGDRRVNTSNSSEKSSSGILGKLTFLLVLGASAGAGYTYYQQNLMVQSLTQTNESTNLRIKDLEAQLRASDSLLEQTEEVATSAGNLANTEIRRLWEDANLIKTRTTNNESDLKQLQNSLKSVDNKLTSLNSKDEELTKKDEGIRWLANQAKNEADAAKVKLDELSGKIGQIDTISQKITQLDGVSAKVAQIDSINKKISIIDELEVAINSIKPTDVSGIEANQAKIINAQNTLLNDQASLENTQSDIKLAMELIADRINALEIAIDVIDDHRMRIQQDLADLKQTP